MVAANDSYVLSAPSLSVTAPGVLANDMPANRTALTASLVSGPANGSLTFNANGSFTYTPGPGFSGRDTFTYRAVQGTLVSNIATVTITGPDSLQVGQRDVVTAWMTDWGGRTVAFGENLTGPGYVSGAWAISWGASTPSSSPW